MHERWAREFGHEAADAHVHDWADEFATGVAAPFTADGTDVDAWADEFEAHAGQFSQAAASTSHGEYVFSPNNPFAKVCFFFFCCCNLCTLVHVLRSSASLIG